MEEQTHVEKALLVAVGGKQKPITNDTLDELAALAETAGAEVISRVVQNLPHPDRATYLGSGKVKELVALVEEMQIDIVILDTSLSPIQLRNLGDAFPCKVIDRTQLILDIFAKRALSRDGHLQVELAQLTYLLPRLIGHSRQLSRLGGGIGTRGPGETKLETDRRNLRRRIAALREDIDELRQQRQIQRQGRKRERLAQVALVGYTNAGKSSLMNLLSGSELLAEDKLFATLDTTTRRFNLLDGRIALLSDTVGFIRNLPTHLIAAFKATLEELQEADLLLHVVDIAAEDYAEQMAAVQSTLEELKIDRPLLVVFNKIDKVSQCPIPSLLHEYPGSIAVSALTGQGSEALLRRIQELLYADRERYTVLIPYDEGALFDPIYLYARVLRREEVPAGTIIELESDTALAGRLRAYRLPEGEAQWTAISDD